MIFCLLMLLFFDKMNESVKYILVFLLTLSLTGCSAMIDKEDQNAEEVGIIETHFGDVVIKFYPEIAPNHVKNFKELAKRDFYDGCRFHRVIPGFMIQGGDPNSKDEDRSNDGKGGSGKTIDAEFTDRKSHKRGIVSMARAQDPDSASSQFFIMVEDKPRLDGKYTIFGKVIEGMDAVDRIVDLKRDKRDNPLNRKKSTMKDVSIDKRSISR